MSPDLSRSLHLSSDFSISCGTVTLDLVQRKMLLILWRKTGEMLLPKGRKNIAESLENAALRETYEETGLPVTLLSLPIPTLATATAIERTYGTEPNAVYEPVAVSQRISDGRLKIIFWFGAQCDSNLTPDAGTQQEGEDFEPIWTSWENAVERLSFKDDKEIALEVVRAALLLP